MELKRTDSVLFKSLYIVAAGIVVSQVLGLDALTSVLFFLTFPLTVLLWGRSVRKTIAAMDLLVLAIAILAIISVLLNALVTETHISFSYVKKLIMFVMSLLFFQTANKMCVGHDMVRFINWIVDILTVFLIAMYFLLGTQVYILNGQVTVYLTFGFSNPNLTGMFMVCLYMLEMYRLFSREKLLLKLIHVVMAVFLAWFVLSSQSRNCLLVLVLYTAVCAWLIFRGRKNMRIGKFTAAVIAVFPALFVLGYMFLITQNWVQELLMFLVEEGKGLDSRMDIWQPALKQLSASPLIGAYSQISNGTGDAQMHNTHLDIAASYGIPVLLLLCFFLGKLLHQNGRMYTNKREYVYILGFACTVLLGIGEAALFSGGLGIYIFIGTFLLLANKKDRESGL